MSKIPKEKKAEYNKRYIEKHKDELREKAKEKIMCKYCNKDISRSSMSTHNNSQKHKLNVEIHKLKNKSNRYIKDANIPEKG